MSDKPKYVNGIFVKEISDKMLIMNINLTKLRDFLKENESDLSKSKKGEQFLNLKIIKRQTAGQYGDTHFVAINEFEPNSQTTNQEPIDNTGTDDQDLPF